MLKFVNFVQLTKHFAYWVYFRFYCRLLYFFKANFLPGIPPGYQTAWIQIIPDMLSGLILIQTVADGTGRQSVEKELVLKQYIKFAPHAFDPFICVTIKVLK